MKKTKKTNFESLQDFEILNIGIVKGGLVSACGADNDRLCSGWCPTAGCQHDGCCGSNYDSYGDYSCKKSGGG